MNLVMAFTFEEDNFAIGPTFNRNNNKIDAWLRQGECTENVLANR